MIFSTLKPQLIRSAAEDQGADQHQAQGSRDQKQAKPKAVSADARFLFSIGQQFVADDPGIELHLEHHSVADAVLSQVVGLIDENKANAVMRPSATLNKIIG